MKFYFIIISPSLLISFQSVSDNCCVTGSFFISYKLFEILTTLHSTLRDYHTEPLSSDIVNNQCQYKVFITSVRQSGTLYNHRISENKFVLTFAEKLSAAHNFIKKLFIEGKILPAADIHSEMFSSVPKENESLLCNNI